MATVPHYIYSHYDPQEKEALHLATGQEPTAPEDESDPWQTEPAFGAQRRLAAAPRFVPAIVSYDEVNSMIGGNSREVIQPSRRGEERSDVSGWYRSLTRSIPQEQSDASQGGPSTAHVPLQPSVKTPPVIAQPQPDKNNWFITRALRSEPSSVSATPTPTLADILARELPSPSSSRPFKPPVFLALGPTNRGWTMLQQKGWSEGEGLGAHASRQRVTEQQYGPSSRRGKARTFADRVSVKTESKEVQLDSDGEINELRTVEVVDLTLSDSEDEVEDADLDEAELAPSSTPSTVTSPHSTPLLTPIPTILKSDRLGIGLKAKTVGPYKASKKRVTHNQAALAAHIRANEEMRRLKAKAGRGSRGFARLAKAESEQRRQLLASLNDR